MSRTAPFVVAGILLLAANGGAEAQQCQPFNVQASKTGYFPFHYGCNDDDYTANPRAAENGDGDANVDDKLCSVYPDAARRKKLKLARESEKFWELPEGKQAGDRVVIKDKAGNQFELWCLDRSDNKTANDPNAGDNRGGRQYGLKFIPAVGEPVWVGRCKFEAGYNTAWWGKNDNGKFAYSIFSNLNTAPQSKDATLQRRDVYLFDVATGCLEVRGEKRAFPQGPPHTDPGGKVLQWTMDRPIIRGNAPASFSDLIKNFSSGTTDAHELALEAVDPSINTPDCPSCNCTPDSLTVFVSGVAHGGFERIIVFGDTVEVGTSAGEPADSAVARLVYALYDDVDLDSMGVRPFGVPGEIHFRNIVGGDLTVSSSDPGLQLWTNELPPNSVPISRWTLCVVVIALAGLGLADLARVRHTRTRPGSPAP